MTPPMTRSRKKRIAEKMKKQSSKPKIRPKCHLARPLKVLTHPRESQSIAILKGKAIISNVPDLPTYLPPKLVATNQAGKNIRRSILVPLHNPQDRLHQYLHVQCRLYRHLLNHSQVTVLENLLLSSSTSTPPNSLTFKLLYQILIAL